MQVENLPGCCGISVIWFLDNFRGDDFERGINNGEAYTLATTIARQRKANYKLKRLGFKVLAKFKNKNSGNVVTLWGRKK